ncbi:MAG TPA: hypothetical protein VEW67_06730 [Thermoleophilaceae bacterium]|nr:hypothetical protein [Thermoleophilaceae bacterium]
MTVSGRDSGQVFVAEQFDIDDSGRMSGLFSAHWESEDGRRSIDGPEDVALEEALAWGRARSDAVLVQVGGGEDGFYSAGIRDLTYDGSDEDQPEPIFPWPAEGLDIAARPVRTAVDGSEQIVLWRVHCEANVQHGQWAKVVTRLLADELVVRVEDPTDPRETADLIVRGRGATAVVLPLLRLIDRCLVDVGLDPDVVCVHLHVGSPDERVLD